MAAGITIDNATYGRDETGLKKLKANLTGDIDTALKSLSADDTSYKEFVNAVSKNWTGADATKLLSEFEKAVKDLATSYKQYKQIIIEALDADLAQFKKMQDENASTISGKFSK